MGLSRPRRLETGDALDDFVCGEPAIDAWIRRRARGNQLSGATAVYVTCESGRVAGFYTLSAGTVERRRVHLGRVTRNMPESIPELLLGRLGVDQRYQGRGLARALLKDAFVRTLAISRRIGVAALLVEALNPELSDFYRRAGFDPISGDEPNTLIIRCKDIAEAHRDEIQAAWRNHFRGRGS